MLSMQQTTHCVNGNSMFVHNQLFAYSQMTTPVSTGANFSKDKEQNCACN